VQVDWIYQQEMHAAEKDGRLYDLQVAFSRDDKKQKTYVQVTPCTCVHAWESAWVFYSRASIRMNMYACVCLILFYVQDLMGEDRNGAQVWELIHNQKGYFYVCGGANMGQQIKLRVIKLAEKYVCVCLLYSQWSG
jgi:hypothetical protein